ncbi:MAG: GSU2403 family nucleotidyltransferase fold protein [Candidatus Binatia bacterium]
MERLSIQLQTAYAELLDQLVAMDAQRAIGHSGGTFVRKRLKGQEYCYYQHALPGRIAQTYVGRRSPALDRVVERFKEGREVAATERRRTMRLCALLRSGGAMTIDGPSARVLDALADAAVFRLGGVLVGTQAFLAIGNLLGVRWGGAGTRTEDIDIVGERDLAVAVPTVTADVPRVLESLEMGFLPVPGLSPRHPTTSFKVRGRALRVDVLTPQTGSTTSPVPIARFRTAAQPLRYLDYLIQGPQQAALLAGSGILVNVPSPARFALHKLVVSRSRPATQQAKSAKDLDQAAQIIDLLAADRPGDLALAWDALAKRQSLATAARAGLAVLRRRHSDAHAAVMAEIDR